MAGATRKGDNLRAHLRRVTAPLHDALDARMRPAGDWDDRTEMVRFLSTQYAARIGIEEWLSDHAGEFEPPRQTPLIAADLAAFDAPLPQAAPRFALPPSASPTAVTSDEHRPALGIAWVLAGSSLGNAAMLKEMQRARHGRDAWPQAFLSDDAMLQFWRALRLRLERPVGEDEARYVTLAAEAAFSHFLAHAHAAARASEIAAA
ncbi:MAG: biliverdin-producing heme oxygenase [Erythrobacter sp.]|nr:biliverdin-producing heme oxygenase [Erythrobacter sp.]